MKSILYSLLLCFVLVTHYGCFFKGEKPKPVEKLYFEPPERLIDDYTSLIDGGKVDWAWSEIGFSFSNYESITVNPVAVLVPGADQNTANDIYQGLTLWFEEAQIQLGDDGQLLCEVAIVELDLEKSFFQKVNVFDESTDHFLLQIELIIKDRKRDYPICKIRHGAVAPDKNVLLHRVMVGLISYFEFHS
jgi:hypothetical protein